MSNTNSSLSARTSRQARRTREGGFTLIELMIVVALIAALAAIALPSFAGQSRKSKGDSEVGAVFAELRVRQEQYLTENAKYLSTGTAETDTFPATASASLQTLGTYPATWTTLKVRLPESKLRCGYVVMAGNGATGTVGTLASGSFGFTKPANNWYYVLAHCNLDGSATKDSYYFMSSVDGTMQKLNNGY
jgi:prepilin-type N-terminal cleavage/methylation domain-containing protein